MRCKNCGKRVPKGASVCPFCNGEELIDYNNKILKMINKNRKKVVTIGSIIVFLLIAFIVAWNLYLKYSKIDINKYVKVKQLGEDDDYGNYNGCGAYKVEFDKTKLVNAISYATEGEDYSKKDIGDLIDDAVDIKKGKNNGKLSNGDVFLVKIKFDNSKLHSYGIHLTGGNITKRVNGLIQTEELDPFADVKLKTKGASPNVKVSVVNTKHPGLNSYYAISGGTPAESDDEEEYDADNDTDYSDEYDTSDDDYSSDDDYYSSDDYSSNDSSNDDVYYEGDGESEVATQDREIVTRNLLSFKKTDITSDEGIKIVTLAGEEKDLEYSENEFKLGDDVKVELYTKIYKEGNKNYLLTKKKHTFKLEKSSEYINKPEQLTEKSMKKVAKEGKDLVNSAFSKMDYVKYFDIKYRGAYLMVEKEDSNENFLELVYKTEFRIKGEKKKYTCYSAIHIKNACIGVDGIVEGDSTDMSGSSGSDGKGLYDSLKDLYLRVASAYSDDYKIYAIGGAKKY